MIVLTFESILNYIQRKAFVREVYRTLYTVEVEREFFKCSHSYYVKDTFADQIETLTQMLNHTERERYEVIYKRKTTRKLYTYIYKELPKHIRIAVMNPDEKWRHMDIAVLVKIHTENIRSLSDLKEILCKL